MSTDDRPGDATNEPADPRAGAPDIPAQEVEHPGLTGDLEPEPDHGESSYRGSGRLIDRVAIVTGGDSGIGRAVAIAFAREGADVHIVCLPEERTDAEVTARHVDGAGRRSMITTVDLRQRDAIVELVDRTVDEWGRLDIVVNNAAYQMALDRMEDLTPEQLTRTFTTNVFAPIWMCQAAVPHLRPGSSIITTTSIQATRPSPKLLDYAATKAAMVNVTTNLGQELAARGIRVNSVAPGPVWTPLIPATMPADQVEEFGEGSALGRAGHPADLAPAFVYLASDDSKFVVGETLHVTGG